MLEDIKIYNKGSILKDKKSGKYIDQIDGVTLLHGNSLRAYLRDKYNITPQEYYNLVMYGDINSYPKCFRCGKNCEFIKFSHGYKSWCHECLIKCHEHKEEKEYEVGTKCYKESLAAKDKVKKGIHNFQTQSKESRVMAQLNSARNTFISLARSRRRTIAYMYIGLCYNYDIKVGITFVGINRRAKASKLKTVHLIRTGTPTDIADLEYELKVYFLKESGRTNEIFSFDKIKEILDFIRNK